MSARPSPALAVGRERVLPTRDDGGPTLGSEPSPGLPGRADFQRSRFLDRGDSQKGTQSSSGSTGEAMTSD
jgi:hypothetical protein